MKIIVLVCSLAASVAQGQNMLHEGMILPSDRYRMQREQELEAARLAEQDRIDHLPSKDPFRISGGRLVGVSEPRWVRFSGEVQLIKPDYIYVQGKIGKTDAAFVLINYPGRVYEHFTFQYSNSFHALPAGTFQIGNEAPVQKLDYRAI